MAPEGEPTRFDSILWKQALDGQVATLAAVVAAAEGKPNEHVVVETVIVDNANPLEVIHPKNPDCYEVRSAGSVTVMLVQDEAGPFTLSAWPTNFPGVFHLVGGVPATDGRWQKVVRWIGNASPAAMHCFLDHDDFIAIGTALSEHAEVEVQRLTGRMRHGRSSYSRGFPSLDGPDLRPDHNEIIAEVESHGVGVRTIHLHVGDVVDVVIRRIAGATFNHGDFEVFEHRVLARLAVAAARRRALFADRQRQVKEPPKQPIQVRLPAPFFTDRRATGEVIRELETRSNTSFAVIHRNPYLHVAVTDETDGSNYDLFVTQPDVIELHPGFRASLGSLSRIAQDLGERFEATDVREEPPPAPVSFYDLAND